MTKVWSMVYLTNTHFCFCEFVFSGWLLAQQMNKGSCSICTTSWIVSFCFKHCWAFLSAKTVRAAIHDALIWCMYIYIYINGALCGAISAISVHWHWMDRMSKGVLKNTLKIGRNNTIIDAKRAPAGAPRKVCINTVWYIIRAPYHVLIVIEETICRQRYHNSFHASNNNNGTFHNTSWSYSYVSNSSRKLLFCLLTECICSGHASGAAAKHDEHALVLLVVFNFET